MRIGIDISQIAYEGTGVSRYVKHIITHILSNDSHSEYVLFGASFRRQNSIKRFFESIKRMNPRVRVVLLPVPLTFLDILWNKLHIMPIQWFIGRIDIFWSSDWIQPPLGKAVGITTIHDMSYLRYPESFDKNILNVQNRRLQRAKTDCSMFLCDSIATQSDVIQLLHIPKEKATVIYPGFSL